MAFYMFDVLSSTAIIILFDAPVVQSLATGSPFKLASVTFGMTSAVFMVSRPRRGIDHGEGYGDITLRQDSILHHYYFLKQF